VFAIYKKELKSYFNSVIGCLFVAVTLFVQGAMFLIGNLVSGSPYLTYALSGTMLILVFTVPILTMKILAEERKLKTDQMLFTAPVSVGKVVLGKYLALCTIYFIAVLITCIYPLVLKGFGDVPIKQSYCAILGLFLYGCTLIAVGEFISSITESQVIAAILGIISLFVCFLAGDFASVFENNNIAAGKVIKVLDIYSPAEGFLNGYIELKNVFYFISVICVFLFFTALSIQKKKWSLSRKNLSNAGFFVGYIAMALVIAIFANLAIGKISSDKNFATLDMTDEKLFKLSDDMKKYLDGVKEDITIFVLYNGEKMDDVIKKSLNNMDSYSKHVKVVYKDIVKNPGFYTRYTEEAPEANSIIIVNDSTNKSKVVDYYDLLESSVDYTSLKNETQGYDCESWVASGINYVTAQKNAVIGTVSGHGESALGSSYIESIEKNNMDYKEVNLLDTQVDVESYQALLMLAPKTDFTKQEAKQIMDYIDAGGKVLMLTNGEMYIADKEGKTYEELVNYESIARHYGIDIDDGVVLEMDENHYANGDPMIALCNNGAGEGAALNNYVVLYGPQSLIINEESKEYDEGKYRYTDIFNTTKKALLKKNVYDQNDYKKADGDKEGSFTVALSVEEINPDTKYEEYISDKSEVFKGANLTVVGSYLAFSAETEGVGSNLEFFENILERFNYSYGEKVTIPPKYLLYQNLTISNGAMSTVGMIVAIIFPIVILMTGIIVWVRRRRL